ncbi:MarR family winged helix-turn-helix transcriptional regulator [Companilactobacillus nantensis]|uniref:Transcriptional regulator n=1 Tax=Companilactobacillus nantensis DSM 16982 TaxID=1423774 RepID=A0A0R1WHP9_9LACO|nr:MarR family transcriptional regulator [Companilactobacillus nantensis]KRM17376.1 transcriptional regulator [Companilactobacillus nantensis DSM 16982]GEO63909.1 transcriptional regulator [Companilactobacillus nantensis]
MNSQFPIEKAIINLITSYKNQVTKKMRPLGLYPGQDLILLTLLKHGQVSQNKLVTELCVDHSTIAKSVRRMVSVDLVQTEKSTEDKRVTLVSLTKHGRDLATQVEKICVTSERAATSGLSTEEQRLFIEMIDHITKNLNK